MARGYKEGLTFFRLDTTLDSKWDLIEAEFGLKGFAVAVKLLQYVFGERGYYGEWNEEVALLFARRCAGGSDVSGNINARFVEEIVSAMIRRGLFDQRMHKKYGILTSPDIQKEYFTAVARRKCVEVEKRYLLLSAREMGEYVNINAINVDINPENADSGTQSRVEKSREEKSREECLHGASSAPKSDFNLLLLDDTYYNVPPEDVEQYKKLYTAINVEHELKKAAGWLEANRRKRKTARGIKAFITGWLGRTQNNPSAYGYTSAPDRNRYDDRPTVDGNPFEGDWSE